MRMPPRMAQDWKSLGDVSGVGAREEDEVKGGGVSKSYVTGSTVSLPIGDKDLLRREVTFENVGSCVSDEGKLDTEAGEDANDKEGDESLEYT
jgi:hypothetical protein